MVLPGGVVLEPVVKDDGDVLVGHLQGWVPGLVV